MVERLTPPPTEDLEPKEASAVADRLTEAEVAELERLEKAATPGPWREGQVGNPRLYGPDARGPASGMIADFVRRADVNVIAAARNALPRLLADRAALRAALAVLADDDCWPTKAEKEHARALLAPPAKEQST